MKSIRTKQILTAMLLCAALLLGMMATASAAMSFTVRYFETEDAKTPSSIETFVSFGTPTATKKPEELGFEEVGRIFKHWIAYRTADQKWRVQGPNGAEWMTLREKQLPDGYSFYEYGPGAVVSETAESGYIHFYAVWNTEGNTVCYYDEEGGNPLNYTTHLGYKQTEKILTLDQLNLHPAGKIFGGWKLHREYDGYWMVQNLTTKEGKWAAAPGAGEDYAFYPDGSELTGFWQTGVVNLYPQWISTQLNVTDYGANGNDNADDYAAIQKALEFANRTDEPLTVYIPSGNYRISGTLSIYSNTTLKLDNSTVITRTGGGQLMLTNGVGKNGNAGGYGRSKNIEVYGGKWDGNASKSDRGNLMLFTHASGISVHNTELVHCCGGHFLELAGVRDSSVQSVTFRDFVEWEGLDYSGMDSDGTTGITAISEALQLDFTNGVGMGSSDIIADDTPCQNITINNCTFENVMSGIGNHPHANDNLSNLPVSTGHVANNNTFTRLKKFCFNLYGFTGISISSNTATNVRSFIWCEHSRASEGAPIRIQNNTILNTEAGWIHWDNAFWVANDSRWIVIENNPVIQGVKDGVHVSAAQDISVIGNTITDAEGNGIRAASSTNTVIRNNTISKVGETGIKVVSGSATVTGNTITDCGALNIHTSPENACSGTIENNIYDLEYGLKNYGNMTRGVNTWLGHDTELINEFHIYYHLNEDAPASEKSTLVPYGTYTPILTVRELGFTSNGKLFAGWKAYWEDEQKWMMKNADGKGRWMDAPEGDWFLYKDGVSVAETVSKGSVLHLYAQWQDRGADYLPGDVNGDGVVDGRDAIRLKRYLDNVSKKKGATITILEKNADLNGDNYVKQDDLTMLLDYLAGVIDSL